MITLHELLKNRGFDFSRDTILVRHKDKRVNIFDLVDQNYFEYYNSMQSRKTFENKKHMIVFIGLESTKALFHNIYRINGTKDFRSIEFPEGYKNIFPEWWTAEYRQGLITKQAKWYNLESLSGFDDLKERIIIDWGQGTLAWVQKYNEKNVKEVIEILPTGYVKEFTDYLDFTLTYNQLKKISEYPEANKRWIDKLSSVNGIYLILDKKTGNQYIGSAYGVKGIWGRWENYINTKGHGGNKLLIELLEKEESYLSNFQWTILETLPANLTKDKVISYESKYKEKLGTKSFGLNLN
jgi:hypothetical protein